MSNILKGLQLNELSNEKLGQYKKAASADATAADKAGDYKRGDKRFSGIVKATKKQFANDEKKSVAEAGNNYHDNRTGFTRPKRDLSGEGEPAGMFMIMIDGRPWKEFTSNQAFQRAKTLADNNPSKKIQVKWPSGQLNTVTAGTGVSVNRAVDANGRTQAQWAQLVMSKFPGAKITQAKMIDGPMQATLPDGRKIGWKKVEQIDEIIDPSTLTAKALRYIGRKIAQAFPWLVVGGATYAASGLLAPIVAATGGMTAALSALGGSMGLATGAAGAVAAPGIIQTIKDLFSADENSIQAGIKSWVEKYVGDDNDVQEFLLVHSKSAYEGKKSFRWRATEWPVKLSKDQAEAWLEKKDKSWLDYEKQKVIDAEKAKAEHDKEGMMEEQLDELNCWSGFHRVAGTKAGFPGSCAKNKTNEEGVAEGSESDAYGNTGEKHECGSCDGTGIDTHDDVCPECGGKGWVRDKESSKKKGVAEGSGPEIKMTVGQALEIAKKNNSSFTEKDYYDLIIRNEGLDSSFFNSEVMSAIQKKQGESVSLRDMVDVVDRHYPKYYAELSGSDISDRQFERAIVNAYKKIMQKQGVAEDSKEDMSKEAKAMASGKCPHCHGPVEKKEHPTLTQYHCAKCGIRASIDKQGVAEGSEFEDAYGQGYSDGYDGKGYNSPFKIGSNEDDEYEDGYSSGRLDYQKMNRDLDEQGVAEGSDTYKQGHAKFHTKTNKQVGPTHYGRSSDKKADSYTKADPRYHEVRPVKEQGVAEEKCPHCSGPMFSELMINEKKDACYYKVKSRYKVWPSAYASGALVKCRKSGADSWGNGGKKNEGSILEGINRADESLHDWFNKEKWVRMDTKGNIKGPCAKEPGEGKPKCLPQAKAHSLGKKGRASAAARKRREDPNPERSGKAINVNTKKKD